MAVSKKFTPSSSPRLMISREAASSKVQLCWPVAALPKPMHPMQMRDTFKSELPSFVYCTVLTSSCSLPGFLSLLYRLSRAHVQYLFHILTYTRDVSTQGAGRFSPRRPGRGLQYLVHYAKITVFPRRFFRDGKKRHRGEGLVLRGSACGGYCPYLLYFEGASLWHENGT